MQLISVPYSTHMRGFTLLELMVSLVIGIILLSISCWGFRQFVVAKQIETVVIQVSSALHYARSSAMHYHSAVVFCGSKDDNNCDGYWSEGQIIKLIDLGILLRKVSFVPVGYHLIWRSSLGINQYLKFFADGGTGQLGSFYCCPPKGSLHYAQEIMINRSGRLKVIKGNFKVCE